MTKFDVSTNIFNNTRLYIRARNRGGCVHVCDKSHGRIVFSVLRCGQVAVNVAVLVHADFLKSDAFEFVGKKCPQRFLLFGGRCGGRVFVRCCIKRNVFKKSLGYLQNSNLLSDIILLLQAYIITTKGKNQ